ncbi:MAG: type VI secretion system tip protein TssI/VgrG [Pseudomonadota bacterium]
MPATNKTYVVKLSGPLGDKAVLKRARVEDRLSTLTRTTVEFMTDDPNTDLAKILGKDHTLEVTLSNGSVRKMHGLCTEAEFLRTHGKVAFYRAVLHPFLWLLTRSSDNRIFQDKDVLEIIKAVLAEHGFGGRIQTSTSHSFAKREYCVQYRETDFAFICRLMEEEGIYYFFDHKGGEEKLVLADGSAAHKTLTDGAKIPYDPADDLALDEDHFTSFLGGEAIVSGKVSLDDYNFETPKADLGSSKSIKKGKHSYNQKELYGYPGRHRKANLGEYYARVKIEGAAAQSSSWRASGSVRAVEVGGVFTLEKHERTSWNQEYMILSAVHEISEELDGEEHETLPDVTQSSGVFDYHAEIDVMKKSEQYRPPQTTPWPDVSGVHVGVVVGKKGEEIWTDKYGRVRVQFHWDKDGKSDDKSSCWVRVSSPWAGKNWGMISVPRIGTEVIVQFEEGDPDRPIITGTLFNADTMPPYALPANATMQGIKTNKSKGGGGFNELVFEDKKEKEFVRFQSERDYVQIIKNNADIKIGMEHKDKGDLVETIHRHKTQTLKTGDHTYKIEKGSQKVDIKKDQTIGIDGNQKETIKGTSTRDVTKDVKETYKAKLTQTITGNTTQTVKQGNYKQEVKMGNHQTKIGMGSVKQEVKMGSVSRKVSMGSIKDTISLGNFTMKASAGKVTIQAMQAIELKVGANKIKIDMTGVTIQGTMLKFKGTAMANLEAPMVTVKGKGMTKVEAPMTMIEGKAMTQLKAPMTMADASALLMLKGSIAMVN